MLAANLVGGPERLFQMMEALNNAADYLHGYGWAKFGIVMQRDEHRVILTLDGQIIVASDVKDAEMPAEVHKLVGKRRDH
jgi:hypothetical protein